MRWPTSSRRFSAQPTSRLSRSEVLARQRPPYTVEILDPIYGDWVIRTISPSFGFAFKKYAELDWPAKRLRNGNGKTIVYKIDD